MDETEVEPVPHVGPDATFDPSLRELFEPGTSAWNRDDVGASLALMAPEIEFSMIELAP